MGTDVIYLDMSNRMIKDLQADDEFELGMDRPAAALSAGGMALSSASGGGVFGWFRYCYTHYDPERDLETLPSPWSGLVACTVGSDAGSAITVPLVSEPSAENDNYTQVRYYRTMGQTEQWRDAQDDPYREYWTDRGALVGEVAAGVALLDKNGDQELNLRTNALMFDGIPPPKCKIAGPYGDIVIFLETEPESGETIGRHYYWSLPGRPGMVPREYVLTGAGEDRRYRVMRPKRPINKSLNPIQGEITATFYDNDQTLIFTRHEIYQVTGPTSHPQIVPLHAGIGVHHQAAVSMTTSPLGLPFSDGDHLWVLSSSGLKQIDSEFGVSQIFQDVAEAVRKNIVVGAYRAQNQIWVAVPGSGKTYPNEIIVFDYQYKKVTKYINAHTSADVPIALMFEFHTHTQDTMHVYDRNGKIWTYPSATNEMDKTTQFECEWKGYFGQETYDKEKTITRWALKLGTITDPTPNQDSNKLRMHLRGVRYPDEVHTVYNTHYFNSDDSGKCEVIEDVVAYDDSGTRRGKVGGQLIELALRRANSGSPPCVWAVDGIAIADVREAGGHEQKDG